MKVAIYGHTSQENSVEHVLELIDELRKDSSFDLFISFGGDGTILRATTYVQDLGIPIVGVNTGRLGFLSTFKKEDVRKLVTEFVNGAFTIVERSLLVASTEEDLLNFGDSNYFYTNRFNRLFAELWWSGY